LRADTKRDNISLKKKKDVKGADTFTKNYNHGWNRDDDNSRKT